jgi:hypothetical protein
MRRLGIILPAAALGLLLSAAPVLACGGLIGPNGAVNLLRTTTFAGYHDGEEHYVTAFQFAGGGGAFGSITPLPGIPSSVVKGGDWTLQRLIRETNPPVPEAFAADRVAAASLGAVELMNVQIDALDITVLKGGSADIGAWAKAHGFRLPPDAPEVLDFYARRSQIFLAAAFDADAAAARGQQVGDGTPVHITIPTDNPWVPLRILALGKTGDEPVEADVYLMTDKAPALLPVPTGENGIRLDHSAAATTSLLDDLRGDRGMQWIPDSAWLTKVAVEATASHLTYDLAIDASGANAPSRIDAGLVMPGIGPVARTIEDASRGLDPNRLLLAITVSLVGILGIVFLARFQPGRRAG